MDIHRGTVVWDSESLHVEVDSVNSAPLAGMSLLYGYELSMHVVEGSTVVIRRSE